MKINLLSAGGPHQDALIHLYIQFAAERSQYTNVCVYKNESISSLKYLQVRKLCLIKFVRKYLASKSRQKINSVMENKLYQSLEGNIIRNL